jgi:hypothetical protein
MKSNTWDDISGTRKIHDEMILIAVADLAGNGLLVFCGALK